jgi:hypothetical protein
MSELKWIEQHGNHYLYDMGGGGHAVGVGVVSTRGSEQNYEWKVFRQGNALLLEDAKALAERSAWNFLSFLRRRWEWGKKTFGPGKRTGGVVEHIRSELEEIEAKPEDLDEWIDVVLLAIDGFNRHGGTCEEFIRRLEAKHRRNEERKWPDWRTLPEDCSIEHIK